MYGGQGLQNATTAPRVAPCPSPPPLLLPCRRAGWALRAAGPRQRTMACSGCGTQRGAGPGPGLSGDTCGHCSRVWVAPAGGQREGVWATEWPGGSVRAVHPYGCPPPHTHNDTPLTNPLCCAVPGCRGGSCCCMFVAEASQLLLAAALDKNVYAYGLEDPIPVATCVVDLVGLVVVGCSMLTDPGGRGNQGARRTPSLWPRVLLTWSWLAVACGPGGPGQGRGGGKGALPPHKPGV